MYKVKDEIERHKGLEDNINIRIEEINKQIESLKQEKNSLQDESKQIARVKKALEALQ